MSRYLVTGRYAYRAHPVGSTFEAVIEPAAERRALMRGDLRLLERTTPTIQPGSYRLPDAWETTNEREQSHG